MAYYFGTLAQSKLEIGSAVITSVPFTLFVMCKTTDVTSFSRVLSICSNNQGTFNGYIVNLTGTVASPNATARILCSVSNANKLAYTSNTYSSDTWISITAVFTNTTSRTVYLDGNDANKGTNTDSSDPSSYVNTTIIGGSYDDNTNTYVYSESYICNVAIYNQALSLSDLTALHKGVSPMEVCQSKLQLYSPLIRGYQDFSKNRYTLNVGGTPVYEPQPKCLRLSRRR